MVPLINPAYNEAVLEQAHSTLVDDEMVLLHKVLDEESFHALRKTLVDLPHKKEHHPLKFSWRRARSSHVAKAVQEHEIVELLHKLTGKRFSAHLYVLKSEDFSLLHDAQDEHHGIVAFYDLSKSWHHSWGGYIGIGNQQFDVTPNSLLILEVHGHQWFVKRVNHTAKEKKVILMFKEK